MSYQPQRLADLDKKQVDGADVLAVQDTAYDENDLKSGLRKVDYRLLPVLGILYLFSYLDRGSLANASIFGFKESLGITVTQYNLIVTVFFFTYGGCEIPGGIILSYVRPNIWLSCICFTWGLVMTLSGLVQNFGGAIAARLALGVAEASFFPTALVVVGGWYPRAQVQSRFSAFYVIGVFSGAFSGLLAYGIHQMDGAAGLESWRWIFILEGIATVLLSGLILVFLPYDPRRCTFLTDNERDAILANRLAEGDGGHAHFKWKYLKQTMTDYKVWMCTFLSSAINMVTFGFSYTLPTILVQLGYKAEIAQLMTVPIYAAACVCVLISGIVSDRYKMRSPMIIAGFSVALIGLLILYILPKTRLASARYFGAVLLMCGVYCAFPGTLAWNSNNSETRGKRNISMAFQLCIASLATAAGTNSYLGREAPDYPTGFGLSMGLCAASILVATALRFLLARENHKLDAEDFESNPNVADDDRRPAGFRYIL